MPRLVIGITGASGSSVAVRALELAREESVETHLVISSWGLVNLKHETGMTEGDLKPLASYTHSNRDLACEIASGSYRTDATLVVPCSARTLGTVANGTGDTLISRAADVALKERRRLVLALRESPLSPIHLRNALAVAEAGAFVVPMSPAFYTLPQSLDELFTSMAARLLDHAGVETSALPRWGEDLSLKRPPGSA
ncbi:UbiX family flavin prenyltransferase [Leucobacter ruminantium]|uniref:Flavin prenyltransferase UbiX n=1 Tax=Leucobacter ruminantium TaxID=1289170 RepID=A0A939RXD1_9MICO|nr:UbiX family flavin prenyltransferase [Leucobacter ruminantium]